jgi:hypothetical protein
MTSRTIHNFYKHTCILMFVCSNKNDFWLLINQLQHNANLWFLTNQIFPVVFPHLICFFFLNLNKKLFHKFIEFERQKLSFHIKIQLFFANIIKSKQMEGLPFPKVTNLLTKISNNSWIENVQAHKAYYPTETIESRTKNSIKLKFKFIFTYFFFFCYCHWSSIFRTLCICIVLLRKKRTKSTTMVLKNKSLFSEENFFCWVFLFDCITATEKWSVAYPQEDFLLTIQ